MQQLYIYICIPLCTYIAYLNNIFLFLVLLQKYVYYRKFGNTDPSLPKESINQITLTSEMTPVNIFAYTFIVFYDTYILLYFCLFHFMYEGFMYEQICGFQCVTHCSTCL